MKEVDIVLSKPQADIFYSRQQVNLFMGGQGAGKTHLMSVIDAVFKSKFPQVRGLIATNTYDQLNKSTMFRIRETYKDFFGLTEYSKQNPNGHYVVGIKPPDHFDTSTHNFDRYSNIISFSWGAVNYMGSLDNYKALDGIEVGYILLDETKDTKQEAVKEVLFGRLRQAGIYIDKYGNLTSAITDKPFNPMYIFTSPAKVPWLNEMFGLDIYEAEIKSQIYYPPKYFFKTYSNKAVSISSTHLNAHNLPKIYISNQEKNLPTHLQNMLIYGDPFAKSGGEFVKAFEREKHVADIASDYDGENVLHFSFDFNSYPYMTCLVYQIEDKAIKQVKEFCPTAPKNSTPALCEELIKFYKNKQIARIFVYGDPSGRYGNRNTVTKDKRSDFSIIKKELSKIAKVTEKIQMKAPSVSLSGDFLNAILEKEYGDISLLIDKDCTNTIMDCLYAKEAADGTIDKHKVKDSETGITYEKFGHCIDAKRYFLVSAFKQEFKKFTGKISGDKEYTNDSYREIRETAF